MPLNEHGCLAPLPRKKATEVERLRAEVRDCHKFMTRWGDANRTLVAALRWIVLHSNDPGAVATARAALEGKT